MLNKTRQWIYSKTWRPLLPCIFRRHDIEYGEREYDPTGAYHMMTTPDICRRCFRTWNEANLEDGTLADKWARLVERFQVWLAG